MERPAVRALGAIPPGSPLASLRQLTGLAQARLPESGAGHPGMVKPVFVVCGARSGSTLLRFVLDAHPDLACPPETLLPGLCAQMSSVGSLLAGTPLSGPKADQDVPDTVLADIRQAVGSLVGPYLQRRGKQRYCDKSLGTAQHASLLARVWPDAKFICVYRHPMDVIASGIEACPWGLNGYGFDSYIAGNPGNAVLALARFWSDTATAILSVEERFPIRCQRVRYEDFVADPENVADQIFRFLGVAPVPGITQGCFTPDRERQGPADYKIWHTSRVSTDSVGRGWSIPAGMISQPVKTTINNLVAKLGYIPVDDAWGAAANSPDPRAVTADGDPISGSAAAPELDDQQAVDISATCELVGARLQAGLFRLGEDFARRWGARSSESFLITATPPGNPGSTAGWRVDLATRSLSLTGAEAGDVSWQVTGPAGTWEQILAGNANLNVALRRRELRYADTGQSGNVTVARISMLADLLAITTWQQAAQPAASVGQPPPRRQLPNYVPLGVVPS
jgi:protein-tyrosine sulfotransferase